MNFFLPYADLVNEASAIKESLLDACERVILSGRYILGNELAQFEKNFAQYCGSRFAVGTSSGTAALFLGIRAFGWHSGSEIITVPNSFVATTAAIVLAGAKPVFVDINKDGNLDPKKLVAAITPKTRAIIPVHLTGRPAKMHEILAIANQYGLEVIEDSAQAIGAKIGFQKVGTFGKIACFSLNPLKNLHAFGDGGIITTDDEVLYRQLLLGRNHGLVNREQCDFFSHNAKLDEIQAAMLNVQLPLLDGWTEARRKAAFVYNQLLAPYVEVPTEGVNEYCVYQTYVLKVDQRDALQLHLRDNGVEALSHYSSTIDQQKAAAQFTLSHVDLSVAHEHVKRILSLPLYPGITFAQQQWVARLIADFCERK